MLRCAMIPARAPLALLRAAPALHGSSMALSRRSLAPPHSDLQPSLLRRTLRGASMCLKVAFLVYGGFALFGGVCVATGTVFFSKTVGTLSIMCFSSLIVVFSLVAAVAMVAVPFAMIPFATESASQGGTQSDKLKKVDIGADTATSSSKREVPVEASNAVPAKEEKVTRVDIGTGRQGRSRED